VDATLRSEILGTGALWLAAGVALGLTLARRPSDASRANRRQATRLFIVLLALQTLHAAEEYATGFHERFPAVFGLAPWPAAFFLALNLSLLLVWAVAGPGLAAGHRPAFLPVWFLALLGVANGVAHPLLALSARGYFPGLLTSPLVGIAGVLLWRRLMTITEVDVHRAWRHMRERRPW